ncbi:hypothetical protein [Croceicoccus bisphenolivorans]|uniref:hypothetical protein n=1 Tax=Croceicoccus bisphenolivorans TaxID=1783232 RepID=UPI0012E7BC3B|nr:hypothetical protein [Croceicoccus bisphenolivorans]
MVGQKGACSPEKQKGRPRLCVNDPLVISAVAAIDFEGFNITETKAWGNKLASAARLWMQRGGFGQRGRISKGDAHRMLRRELAALSAGGDA